MGGLAIFIILLGIVAFFFIKSEMEFKAYVKETASELERDKEPLDTQEGHFHADGTFHAGKPPDPIQTEQKRHYTAPKGAATKPEFPKVDSKADPVKAAYKRLEYIKNNPYAWGGVHSPRATKLITQLMPASVPTDHDHGDHIIEQIEELIDQGDPRAAEVLIAHMCDGGTVGHAMTDALAELGPPAVPYILPYLEKFVAQGGITSVGMFYALEEIDARYRDDLGGIIQHIIIPKLKVIAADKNNERYDSACVIVARSVLRRLLK